MRRLLLALSLLVSVLGASSLARAQWPLSAAPVCTAVNDQLSPAMIPDGAGGTFLAWNDYRADSFHGDIYAQRVNAFGVSQWAANGVAVCTAADNQNGVVIVPDGGTGCIIAWYDTRSGLDTDIYAQRLNASGVPQWTANGVALSVAVGSQIFLDAIPDGAGGAIVVWEDHRASGNPGDIYAQRVNASGVPQWTANGVAVCTAGGDQLGPHIAADGAGGAIMVWTDYRLPAQADIYAQRVNAAGVAQWAANGVAACAATGDQNTPQLVSDGANGAVITWRDARNIFDTNIFAQRFNGSGTALWLTDGTPMSSAANDQVAPVIVSDGAAGAVIAWEDYRNGPSADVYAQRVSAGGSIQWQLDGIPIATASGYQTNPYMVSDGSGGAFIAFRDNRNPSDADAYMQHVNAFGVALWPVDGVQVTSPPAQSAISALVWDGAAATIATYDYRNGPSDVYAQRVEGRYGYWGHPEPVVTSVSDVPKDQGGHVAVNWTASQRDVTNPHTVDSYTVWRAVSTVPFGVEALRDIKDARGKQGHIYLSAGPATDYYWELVGTQAAHGWAGYSFSAETRADSVAGNMGNERFMVAAQTNGDDFVAFQSNAVAGHSVDNLAPSTPLLLTISQSGPNAVLNWKPVPDADLAHYTLYRKTGSGVTPVTGNFLTNESLTNHIDAGAAAGGYYYIVVAVDAHGNASAPSNEVSLNGSTGVDGATPPAHLVVDANAPNPFANQSAFRVGLPRAASIDVTLYDVGGRLVGEQHVAGVRGWQRVTIDGRRLSGGTLASGVYFYRVSAAGETITHKMVIAR